MFATCRRLPGLRGYRRGARRLALRAVFAVPAAALALFHALLLWQRVASSSLLEPGVLLRWGGALALVLALVRLRRRGVSLLWSRQALVFWLLVALLHAGAVPAPAARAVEPSAGLVLALTVSLASLGGLAALAGDLGACIRPAAAALCLPPRPAFRARSLAPLRPRPPPA